jgi:phosphoribulokinase
MVESNGDSTSSVDRETLARLNCHTLRSQLQQLRKPMIVGVSGDSGSGKTTYSNGIRSLIGADLVNTLELDGYHKEDRQQRKISGRLPLDPDANRLDLIREHLTELKQGKSVEIPIYNHKTGKFDRPKQLFPSPIMIMEGLHALYPELLPFLDFSIYVDPDRDVKWQWKYERDVKKRGHLAETLQTEMLQREAAYKRWIDFQKTNANVVIKIFTTRMKDFSRHQCIADLPANCYKVELIVEPALLPLPTLPLPFDLGAMLGANQLAFMLAALPCIYWGRQVTILHIDGILPSEAIAQLQNHIVDFTGIPINEALPLQEYERISATRFAQLLVTWRFLEQVNYQLQLPQSH